MEHYWYQVETVRKVLKQFRGRVLLADEVGLGKTVEAGMVLKEYLLRGMADRMLILAPPSLVGQWREEMETKFDIEFRTTHSSLLRKDPAAFWAQEHIIASIAAARLPRHMKHLSRHTFDIVVVDEAHHLKNRSTQNWKLVDALKKRFLHLLSATPVQNNLVEIYNLLTLLKPGLFATEKDFRTAYVKPRHPRVPINREHLQDLMRDVMIRNTRALVDVKLPPRQVVTIRVAPSPEEADVYQTLGRLIREMREDQTVHHRLALTHLLQSAGSSPAAATAAIHRFCAQDVPPAWQDLHTRYATLADTAKAGALFELLDRNPNEKKLIFVRFRETLKMLGELLDDRGLTFERFEGSMSGPQKDEAVERFRDESGILLCTESGGEGRNLQFCNT
ncbi:MAG: DEAD/DEAH box helicase, partial [Lentisphaerae bacterium]|nr:DEAD/DEAH box helicase [Lentisphaerota bacterium]